MSNHAPVMINEKRDGGITPIIDVNLPLDSAKEPLPQWPYILAEAFRENEVDKTRALIKTVMIIVAATNFNGPGQPLERFKCPRIDDEWEMDPDDYFDWQDELSILI